MQDLRERVARVEALLEEERTSPLRRAQPCALGALLSEEERARLRTLDADTGSQR